jgi:hypothetical protein
MYFNTNDYFCLNINKSYYVTKIVFLNIYIFLNFILYKIHVVFNPDKRSLLPRPIFTGYSDCVHHGLIMCTKVSQNIRLFYKVKGKEAYL